MDSKLQDFYTEINGEIKQYRIDHGLVTANTSFKEVFLSYLEERVPALAQLPIHTAN